MVNRSRAALVAACLVAPVVLGGCATQLGVAGVGASAGITGTATAVIQPTVVDKAIAKYSPKLARYCTLLETATYLGSFSTAGKTKAVFDAGSAVLDAFCTAPPSNVATALATVSAAYTGVVRAAQAK